MGNTTNYAVSRDQSEKWEQDEELEDYSINAEYVVAYFMEAEMQRSTAQHFALQLRLRLLQAACA